MIILILMTVLIIVIIIMITVVIILTTITLCNIIHIITYPSGFFLPDSAAKASALRVVVLYICFIVWRIVLYVCIMLFAISFVSSIAVYPQCVMITWYVMIVMRQMMSIPDTTKGA